MHQFAVMHYSPPLQGLAKAQPLLIKPPFASQFFHPKSKQRGLSQLQRYQLSLGYASPPFQEDEVHRPH